MIIYIVRTIEIFYRILNFGQITATSARQISNWITAFKLKCDVTTER